MEELSMTTREQELMGLVKRLLAHSESLQDQIDRPNRMVVTLSGRYKTLRHEFEQMRQATVVERAASEVFLGAAMDQLLAERDRQTP
jgi:hypothetical protein